MKLLKLVKIISGNVFLMALAACADVNGINNIFKNDHDKIVDEENAERENVVRIKEKVMPAEYKYWIENEKNGIVANKTIGDFKFSVLFRPYNYIVVNDLKMDTIKEDQLKTSVNEINGSQYYTFRITAINSNQELLKVGIKSDEEYGQRIEYFSFKMQNDFKLIDGKDTLDCSLFHYERVYGLAPHATFSLGFPLSQRELDARKKGVSYLDCSKTISYDDKMFGVGKTNITINAKNLNNIPGLLTFK